MRHRVPQRTTAQDSARDAQSSTRLQMAILQDRLAPSEWKTMLALWRIGKPASTVQVMLELGEVPPRDYRTIQTLLNRCVEKGWVKVVEAKPPAGSRSGERGRPPKIFYRPTVPWRQAVRAEIRYFMTERLEAESNPEVLELLEEFLAKYETRPKVQESREQGRRSRA